jgi:hypothetical protein
VIKDLSLEQEVYRKIAQAMNRNLGAEEARQLVYLLEKSLNN